MLSDEEVNTGAAATLGCGLSAIVSGMAFDNGNYGLCVAMGVLFTGCFCALLSICIQR